MSAPGLKALARAGAVALAAGTVAACSVLRVDVDVYKGPLANESHVQVQQLVAMATGAKPLLTDLRDRLEWSDKQKRQDAQSAWWYDQGFMRPITGRPEHSITQPQAHRVNAVLSLYETAARSGLAPLLRDAETYVARYRKANKAVEPDPDKDEAFWSRIEPHIRDHVDLQELKNEYRAFLVPVLSETPDYRNAAGIYEVFHAVVADRAAFERCRARHQKWEDDDGKVDWYETLQMLSVRANADCHARALFPDPGPSSTAREEFAQRVHAIAMAGVERQRALRQLWSIGLRTLDRLRAPDKFGLEFEREGQREAIISPVARGVARLTQHQILSEALRDTSSNGGKSCEDKTGSKTFGLHKLGNRLKENAEKIGGGENPWADKKFRTTNEYENQDILKRFDVANKSLRRVLVEDVRFGGRSCPNVSVMDVLRTADIQMRNKAEHYKSKTNEPLEKSYFYRRGSGQLTRVADNGLVRAAGGIESNNGGSGGVEVEFNEIAELVREVSAASAAGFERGRLREGIEDLTEAYLKQHAEGYSESANPDELDDVRAARQKLVDALVRFSEKVLRIANFESLLPKGGSDTVQGSVGEGRAAAQRAGGRDDVVDRYVLVLQGIGNTIQVQANEMAARQKYQERNTGTAAEVENWALQRGLTQGQAPAQTYDALISVVEDERDRVATRLDRARDLVKEIEARSDGAASGTESDKTAQALAAALEAYRDAGGDALGAAPTVEEAKAVVADLKERKSDLESALALFEKVAPKLVSEAFANRDQRLDPIARLDTRLAKLAGDDDAKTAESARAARGVLRAFAPVRTAAGDLPVSDQNTRVQNFDALLRLLVHMHNESLRQRGPDAQRTRYLADALRDAYAKRSEMVYVRPASAYLRSVYAATGLQSDPRVRWTNMLGDHALRSLPLIGSSIANDDPGRLETLAEIDRQSWQRVNSVRVAGSGDTNYVLAKDDIGNWYIKSYSSDTEDIVNSARQLLLFNLSGGLDTSLIAERRAPDGGDELTRSRIATLFEQTRTTYRTEALEDYRTLEAELAEDRMAGLLATALPSGAAGAEDAADAFEGAVRQAHAETLAPALARQAEAAGEDGDPADPVAATVELLQATMAFHDALQARVTAEAAANDDNDAALTRAGRQAGRILREKVADRVAVRRTQLDQFQTQLDTLSELATPE